MDRVEVEAILVRLAAVERGRLELPRVREDAGGQHAEEMCVASCQWWPIGAVGMSIADGRCMNATGPSAGSPEGAA